MVARAEAFVLEDNPKALQALVELLTSMGLATIETRSPSQGVRLLQANSPTIAIVDWNMEQSPDLALTSEEVLRTLAASHPQTYTVVYATNVGGDLRLQERIAQAHPAAITHDKQLGPESLRTRIQSLLGRRVGDLKIDRGTVLHLPSGLRFPHAVAVNILLKHPQPLRAVRRTGPYQALWRFRNWLDEVGSTMTIESRSHGFHSLVEVGDTVSPAACAPAPADAADRS